LSTLIEINQPSESQATQDVVMEDETPSQASTEVSLEQSTPSAISRGVSFSKDVAPPAPILKPASKRPSRPSRNQPSITVIRETESVKSPSPRSQLQPRVNKQMTLKKG
jgi:hypothetical protein